MTLTKRSRPIRTVIALALSTLALSNCTGRSAVTDGPPISPDPGLMTKPMSLPAVPAGEGGTSMAAFGRYANDLRRVCVANRHQTSQLQDFIRKLESLKRG